MNRSLLLALLLLPACSLAPPERDDPQALQRARLQQLFRHDMTAEAPSPVQHVRPSARWLHGRPLQQEPQQPQQPQPPIGRRPGERAIDDVEPAVGGRQASGFRDAMGFRQDGERSHREVRVTAGATRFGFHAADTQLHDDVQALQLAIDTAPDPSVFADVGLRVDGFVTESDLFHGETVFNGLQQRPADATAYGIGMFPHAVLHPLQQGDFELPMRLGVFVDWMQLDHHDADVRRDWFWFGPRVELEPEYTFWRGARGSMSAFAHLGGDFGGSQFRETWANDDDSALGTRWRSEVGAGVRWQWRSLVGELSYRYRDTDLGGIDSDLFGGIRRVELRDQGLFLSIGGRF